MPRIELLAPAKDLATGIAAINSGADAVYIGAARFGARSAAGNPLGDIESLASHAHKYWARVYVTLNTLLRDDELEEAVHLARQIYECGVDALIIQDFGLLECDLPPIPLFASTQTHNSTPDRIEFLEQVGFRRVILARESSLELIQAIRARTTIELESFVHGALCVSYSGQCYLSYARGGRSGNRGECAQPCRLPYTLVDENGRVLLENRHLLSIRDLNLTDHLRELVSSGITSFKIEGRLKEKNYVVNLVGHYRKALDALLRELGERKSSSGEAALDFAPDPNKTFNRGYTTYFLAGRRNRVGANDSPKMVGEPAGRVQAVGRDSFVLDASSAELNSGDGLSFFDRQGRLTGTMVMRTAGKDVFPAKMTGIERGLALYRNYDHQFISQLGKSKPCRKIGVKMLFRESPGGYRLELTDEDGVQALLDLKCEAQTAQKQDAARATLEKQMRKLGGTEFACAGLALEVQSIPFVAVSLLNDLRRGAIESLREQRRLQRQIMEAAIIPNSVPYPERELNYLANVLNRKAAAFFQRHEAVVVEPAAESCRLRHSPPAVLPLSVRRLFNISGHGYT